ncbi:MAG: hypothetical protein AB8F74_03385 [Saprospiraceae bacterium]
MKYSINSIAALFLTALLLLFYSCSEENERFSTASSFFDLKLFFNKELDDISLVNEIQKTVEINGVMETETLSKNNLEKEINVFSNSDINRLAWLDKYQVDSVFTDQGLLRFLRHRAIDKSMRTQLLEVCYSKQKVTSIFIRNIIDGFATNSKKEITYAPGYGYSILTEQKTLFGSRQEFKVDVKYMY